MIALLLATVLAQSYYTPAEAQALFAQANEAYAREDYPAAREGYLKLVDHGFGGADVLFNLGTAALAQGDLGEATLALERARREGDRGADLEANLALARARQLDQVVGAQAEEPFLQRLAANTGGEGAAAIFLGSWLAGGALLLAWAFWARARRVPVAIAGAALLLLALPSGALTAVHAYVQATVDEGVVMARTLAAHELPRDNAKTAFEVHAGLKVRMLEQSGDFVRIRLPNGLEGWAQAGGLSRI